MPAFGRHRFAMAHLQGFSAPSYWRAARVAPRDRHETPSDVSTRLTIMLARCEHHAATWWSGRIDARFLAVITEHRAVDQTTDDAREEDHEVFRTPCSSGGDHVAVRHVVIS